MKLLILLLIFISAHSQKDNFRGHVSDINNGENFHGITVELYQSGKIVYQAQTDIDGNFYIQDVEVGSYEFRLKYIGYETYVIKEFYFSRNDRVFEFDFPDPCKETVKICPKNHSDKLIPIVYGLPRGNGKLLRQAKNGKVILGGCVVTYCDPKWYCKKHNISF
jgi:hypothetical protein